MADTEAELPKSLEEVFLEEFDKYEKRLWQKMPPARFSFWSKRELWTLIEFAYLLKGKEPLEKEDDRVVAVPDYFATYFKDLASFVVDAIHLDVLNPIVPYQDAGVLNCLLTPREWLEWAKGKEFPIPDELVKILEKEPDQKMEIQDNVDPRERTTLLQIIAVLAAEAKLDLTKHSKAAGILQEMAATHGKDLPKKKDTIANKLKEARDLQKSR